MIIILLIFVYLQMSKKIYYRSKLRSHIQHQADQIKQLQEKVEESLDSQKLSTPVSTPVSTPISTILNNNLNRKIFSPSNQYNDSITPLYSSTSPTKYKSIGHHISNQGWEHVGIIYTINEKDTTVYNLYKRKIFNNFEYLIVDDNSVPIRLKNVEGSGPMGELKDGDEILSIKSKEAKGPFKVDIYDEFKYYLI